MYDFSTARVRASSIYAIMGGSDRKTNLQQWEEAAGELARQELMKANLKKKDGPRMEKIEATIFRLKNCIEIFELVKNDPLPLSSGAKTFCSALYADVKYGKWNPTKDIGNKYTSKGKAAEEASIDLVSRLEKELYVKNDLMYQNEWLRGTPDIIVGNDPYNAEKILDVKSPWDCETFFANLNQDLVPQYEFQMQGYMAICNAPVAEVHFCLVDVPDYLWQKEKYNLFNRMEVVTEEDTAYKAAEAQLLKNLTFGDIPLAERRLKFTVHRDDKLIEKIYRQVEKCREYLFEVEKRHLYPELLLPLEEMINESQDE